MKSLGFLEYAWTLFVEKDRVKTKLLLSSEIPFPRLYNDNSGLVCAFPEPIVILTDDESTVSLMGNKFHADAKGKSQLVSLFRASVFHLGAHVMCSNYADYEEWKKRKDNRLTRFIISLLEDVGVNAYIALQCPNGIADIAFANTLSLKRLRRIGKVFNPATRLMAGLLMKMNTGIDFDELKKEQSSINNLNESLIRLKEKSSQRLTDCEVNLKEEKLAAANEIYNTLVNFSTIIETPFLPHTEELGKCSIFPPFSFIDSDVTTEETFKKCLKHLGGSTVVLGNEEQASGKMVETESVQVFDSWQRQKEKDTKTLSKYESLLPLTSFKSIVMPEQDYTEYLRTKSRCKSEAHRLIESLLVARDAVDEDPRKLYGVLDLQEMIQVVASKSPSVDVFMLDQNLSKSYSWVILLDASKSMKCIKEFAMDILIMLAEVAGELLQDQYSWAMYAFNDRFLVLKDFRDRYNTRVKSLIGGLKFEGFTYMPDALKLAGQVIKSRTDNMRLILVISDGWPYGYSDMSMALSETLKTLAGGNISVIGIGAQSKQMEFYFKSCGTVYTLRDLTKKFSHLYMEASNTIAES